MCISGGNGGYFLRGKGTIRGILGPF